MEGVDFQFPGSPYGVQFQFMNHAYSAMISGGLCILESPTGTGKSLSMLCSALAWLRDFRVKVVAEKLSALEQVGYENETLPLWIQDGMQKSQLERAVCLDAQWKLEKSKLRSEVSLFGVHQSNGFLNTRVTKRKSHIIDGNAISDEDLLVTDEISAPIADANVSTKIDPNRKVQIIICSRTHSQLAQLVREMKRISLHNLFNIVTIGSRSQLCINPSVDTSRGPMAVNDSCRQLTDSNCCELRHCIEPLSKVILSDPLDIEDMRVAGRNTFTRGCPYFASRLALNDADIVFVPYSSILHSGTRESLGLNIKGNVIIVDEAHNILEAVNSVRSTSFSIAEIDSLSISLSSYLQKFGSKLSPLNLVTIKSLQFVTRRLSVFTSAYKSEVFNIPEFLAKSKLSEIDLPKVTRFLDDFQFSRKLKGFSEKHLISHPNAIYGIASLLLSLQGSLPTDKMIVTEDPSDGKTVRFASIECEAELAKLVEVSRAVLLVGGTMEPFSEHRAVASLANVPMTVFSGSSVINEDRIFCGIVAKASDGIPVSYDRNHRDGNECTRLLIEIVTSVCISVKSGGIIVFVTSYEYARKTEKLLGPICREHGNNVYCDGINKTRIFSDYVNRIQTEGKAVLIAVVNGSLSEGIDFKDELCRCVVLVGVPYPNPTDPLVIERMRFLDEQHRNNPNFIAGDQYYQGRCMKSVNQCIGRSIRHSKDWASIILVDDRFRRPEILSGLSCWIREKVKDIQNPSVLQEELKKFHAKWA